VPRKYRVPYFVMIALSLLVGSVVAGLVGYVAGDSEILRGAIAYLGEGLMVLMFLVWIWGGKSKGY